MVVRENIDFERGQDPKIAMGIGISSKWKQICDYYGADKEMIFWNPEEIKEIGLTPSSINIMDPGFIKNIGMHIFYWIEIFNDNKEIEILDKSFDKGWKGESMETINPEKFNSIEMISKKLPLTAKAIIRYPLPFMNSTDNNIALVMDLYNNYFNPFNYNIEDLEKYGILTELKDPWRGLSKIINDYPQYLDYFIKNAPIEIIIKRGYIIPEIFKHLSEKENIGTLRLESLEYLLNYSIKKNIYSIIIFSKYLNSHKEISSSFLRLCKKKIQKNLDSETIQKYFSILFT